MKIERIMVATDFSAAGNRAVQEAAAWARRHAAAIRVVHVVPPMRWLSGLWNASTATVAVVHRNAADALRRVAESVDLSRQLQISTALLTGRASKEIARAARAFDSELLVIGAHGVRGHMDDDEARLGGTAAKLSAVSQVPLLLVRRSAPATPSVVLAAVDLSPASATVLDWARAGAADGRLHVLHAYEVPFAERLEAYGLADAAIDVYSGAEHATREQALAELVGADAGSEIERIVVRGDAVKQLFGHIRRLDATLVVLGRQSPHGWRRASTTFGSVFRYATTFAPTNLLVVPAP